MNGDGVLSTAEMSAMLERSGFRFSAEQIAEFMAVADSDHNGVVDYNEFIPAMTSLVKARNARKGDAAKLAAQKASEGEGAKLTRNVWEVPEAQLALYLRELFKAVP